MHRVASFVLGVGVVILGWWQASYASDQAETNRLIEQNAQQISALVTTVAVQQEQISAIVTTVKKAAETAESNSKALGKIDGKLESLERSVERRAAGSGGG